MEQQTPYLTSALSPLLNQQQVLNILSPLTSITPNPTQFSLLNQFVNQCQKNLHYCQMLVEIALNKDLSPQTRLSSILTIQKILKSCLQNTTKFLPPIQTQKNTEILTFLKSSLLPISLSSPTPSLLQIVSNLISLFYLSHPFPQLLPYLYSNSIPELLLCTLSYSLLDNLTNSITKRTQAIIIGNKIFQKIAKALANFLAQARKYTEQGKNLNQIIISGIQNGIMTIAYIVQICPISKTKNLSHQILLIILYTLQLCQNTTINLSTNIKISTSCLETLTTLYNQHNKAIANITNNSTNNNTNIDTIINIESAINYQYSICILQQLSLLTNLYITNPSTHPIIPKILTLLHSLSLSHPTISTILQPQILPLLSSILQTYHLPINPTYSQLNYSQKQRQSLLNLLSSVINPQTNIHEQLYLTLQNQTKNIQNSQLSLYILTNLPHNQTLSNKIQNICWKTIQNYHHNQFLLIIRSIEYLIKNTTQTTQLSILIFQTINKFTTNNLSNKLLIISQYLLSIQKSNKLSTHPYTHQNIKSFITAIQSFISTITQEPDPTIAHELTQIIQQLIQYAPIQYLNNKQLTNLLLSAYHQNLTQITQNTSHQQSQQQVDQHLHLSHHQYLHSLLNIISRLPSQPTPTYLPQLIQLATRPDILHTALSQHSQKQTYLQVINVIMCYSIETQQENPQSTILQTFLNQIQPIWNSTNKVIQQKVQKLIQQKQQKNQQQNQIDNDFIFDGDIDTFENNQTIKQPKNIQKTINLQQLSPTFFKLCLCTTINCILILTKIHKFQQNLNIFHNYISNLIFLFTNNQKNNNKDQQTISQIIQIFILNKFLKQQHINNIYNILSNQQNNQQYTILFILLYITFPNHNPNTLKQIFTHHLPNLYDNGINVQYQWICQILQISTQMLTIYPQLSIDIQKWINQIENQTNPQNNHNYTLFKKTNKYHIKIAKIYHQPINIQTITTHISIIKNKLKLFQSYNQNNQ